MQYGAADFTDSHIASQLNSPLRVRHLFSVCGNTSSYMPASGHQSDPKHTDDMFWSPHPSVPSSSHVLSPKKKNVGKGEHCLLPSTLSMTSKSMVSSPTCPKSPRPTTSRQLQAMRVWADPEDACLFLQKSSWEVPPFYGVENSVCFLHSLLSGT